MYKFLLSVLFVVACLSASAQSNITNTKEIILDAGDSAAIYNRANRTYNNNKMVLWYNGTSDKPRICWLGDCHTIATVEDVNNAPYWRLGGTTTLSDHLIVEGGGKDVTFQNFGNYNIYGDFNFDFNTNNGGSGYFAVGTYGGGSTFTDYNNGGIRFEAHHTNTFGDIRFIAVLLPGLTEAASLTISAQPGNFKFQDSRAVPTGLQYGGDYSANYTSRSIVDKAYVDNSIGTYFDNSFKTGSVSLDFDLTSVNFQDLTITVTGAATGDVVSLATPIASVTNNVIFTAWVSTDDEVTIRASRIDVASGANPDSGVFKAVVFKF